MQWRMLQQDQPEDFVIATGRQESVRRFIELSASALGWGALVWTEGLRKWARSDTGAVVVRIDPRYFRPAGEHWQSNPCPREAGLTPCTNLEGMVSEMINHDREEAQRGLSEEQGLQRGGPRE